MQFYVAGYTALSGLTAPSGFLKEGGHYNRTASGGTSGRRQVHEEDRRGAPPW
jgi:hypothetical protein